MLVKVIDFNRLVSRFSLDICQLEQNVSKVDVLIHGVRLAVRGGGFVVYGNGCGPGYHLLETTTVNPGWLVTA